jgi:small-conductance mechanosensitive channel
MTSAGNKAIRDIMALIMGMLSILLMTCSQLYADTAGPQVTAAPSTVYTTSAPVSINDKVLFYVQSKILSISPENRAEIITKRIEKLSKDPLLDINSITISDSDTTTDIVAGDLIIMTVTEDDAKAAGRSRTGLATEYAGSIKSAIDVRIREYSLKAIVFGALFAFISTVVFVLLMIFIKKLFLRTYDRLYSWKDVRIRGLKFQKLEILSSAQVTDAAVKTAKLTRAVLVVLLLYFYVPLVLSFFPWTRRISATIFSYIISPLRAVGSAIISYLPNLFFIAVIVAVAHYVLKLIKVIFEAVEKENIKISGFYAEWAVPTYKIVRFLVIAFTAIVAFPYFPGSESPAFRGVSIFLGVLFSLGSTAAVANIVAGVILTYMRAFTIGDRVKISDTTGDIIEKTLLVTRVRTIKNEDITIPNAMVLGSHIINYSSSAKDRGLILHTTVTIGYDAPWEKVHELLIAAALSTEHILKEPAPFILQTGLDDFYVRYELNAYTSKPGIMAVIYSRLHQNIQDTFNEAGVEIMSPHYSSLRDGNQTAIPENYLAKGYAPPGFNIAGLGDLLKKSGKKPQAEEGQ